MNDRRKILGKKGERIAEKFLRRRGYKIVERNYRCSFGEIDLIAIDGEYLVFVEVKTRSSAGPAPPQQAVNGPKQRRLARLAAHFLTHSRHLNPREEGPPNCRFDVVAVSTTEPGGKASVELFQNAFLPSDSQYTL
jgi:putative endonuclease